MNGMAGPPVGGMPMGPLATSNPAALHRPGVGQNTAAATFNNRVREVTAAGLSGYAAQDVSNFHSSTPGQFRSYNGAGNAHLNGVVPTKVFNGVVPTRPNPNPLQRYEYSKRLREF